MTIQLIDKKSDMIFCQHRLRTMLTWFLNPRTRYLDRDGHHVVSMVADFISASYGSLNPDIFPTNPIAKVARAFEPEKYLANDPEYLRPVIDLYEFAKRHIKPYVSHFYLHGSLATLDYCKGWSDLDTFIVINKNTIRTPSSLMALREACISAYDYLLQIDPLQHHGFIFASEYDLCCYPSCFLPPAVIDYAISLLPGAEEIVFHMRDSFTEVLNGIYSIYDTLKKAVDTEVFKHHAYKGEYLRSGYSNAENGMYQYKYLLGYITMAPCYFLEIKGESIYKKDSFAKCKNIFDATIWGIIRKTSEIRRLWPQMEVHPYTNNVIPTWVQDIMGPDYFKESCQVIEAVLNEIN